VTSDPRAGGSALPQSGSRGSPSAPGRATGLALGSAGVLSLQLRIVAEGMETIDGLIFSVLLRSHGSCRFEGRDDGALQLSEQPTPRSMPSSQTPAGNVCLVPADGRTVRRPCLQALSEVVRRACRAKCSVAGSGDVAQGETGKPLTCTVAGGQLLNLESGNAANHAEPEKVQQKVEVQLGMGLSSRWVSSS